MKSPALSIMLAFAFMLLAVTGCKEQDAASSPADASSAVSSELSKEDADKQELQEQLEDIKDKAAQADASEGKAPADSELSEVFDKALEESQEAISEELASKSSSGNS